jgi:hypothetical protein
VVFETEKYHRKYETTFTSKIIDPLDFEPTWFYEFHISRQKIQMILKLKKCQKYLLHVQQYFSYIMALSFIGGGNRSARIKPPTSRQSLIIFIT